MDKERDKTVEGSFSEKELDLAVDKSLAQDQTKGSTIFDPKKTQNPKK